MIVACFGLRKVWGMESVESINPIESVIQTTYDIIKAHIGEIKVESKVKERSAFIIELPINQLP